MTDRNPVELTSTGRSRREDMLGELIESMNALHRRRRIRRRAGAAGAVSLVLLVAIVFQIPRMLSNERTTIVDGPPILTPGPLDHAPRPGHGQSSIKIIHSRPDLVARFAHRPSSAHRVPHVSRVQRVSPPGPSKIRTIDDSTLLTMLAQIDRPTGLIRAEGRVYLTSAVTDAELESMSQPAS